MQNLLLTTLKLDVFQTFEIVGFKEKLDVYQTFLTVGFNEKQTCDTILALYFHNVNGTCKKNLRLSEKSDVSLL